MTSVVGTMLAASMPSNSPSSTALIQVVFFLAVFIAAGIGLARYYEQGTKSQDWVKEKIWAIRVGTPVVLVILAVVILSHHASAAN